MTAPKGGYQAQSRLDSAIDEIAMEATAALNESSNHRWREAFEEIVRLARHAQGLVTYVNTRPGAGLSGAAA